MNALEKDYGSKVKFVVKPAAEELDTIQSYELGSHGMVLCGSKNELLWKESGHKQTRAGIEAAIKKALGE
ncbi:MAG: hypothetical protein NXI31_07530 [bacterium]|nr:hypothetical protein [bacterium]